MNTSDADNRSPRDDGMVGGSDQAETICGLFDEQARGRAGQTAIIDGTKEVSYDELYARATVIACEVAARGVAPGSLVGVCMGRTWHLVATLLGILRAGCAYVPLDPNYPTDRVRYMLDHSRVAAAIIDDGEAARLCAAAPHLLHLDEMRERRTTTETAVPVASDLAYVIYTSGSTGRPKGVAVEHRSVVAMTRSMRALLDDEDLTGVLAATSVCFDPSVMEILGTLTLGGTVVLSENVLAVRELPAAHRVRTTIMVPSAMRGLLTTGDLPSSIRCVVFGGEVLNRQLVDRVHASAQRPRVFNVYGPTEATVYTTAAEILPGHGAITIGTPVPGSRAYILDHALQPTPPGVPGELCLAGDQLARGYLHDEEHTRGRFVELDGNGPNASERLYRTGDQCIRTGSGELEFLGRSDRQVKIRGFRIELDEVEAVLESMPGVDEAAVMVLDTEDDKKLLIGYVVSQGRSPSAAVTYDYLADRIPTYMRPHHVVLVAQMPRLPNGKLDHSQLPKPVLGADREAFGTQVTLPEPITGDITGHCAHSLAGLGREEQRAALLSVVRTEIVRYLGLSDAGRVMPEESLERLGLDSLDRVELSVRLSHVLSTTLPASTLVDRSTPATIVEQLLDGLGGDPTGQARPINGVGGASPEGPAQLEVFQAQIQSGYPPFLAAKVPAWSASDKGALVRGFKGLLSRSGLDPYGKVVRTGSADRGTIVDEHTGEERDALIWTTNLYLGLNRDSAIIGEARDALTSFGTGMGISAAGSGQTDLHLEFEQEFAGVVGKPAACLFPTGFTASLGAVTGIVGHQDVVVMDQLCHASLVDGARLSGAAIRTFRHNDPNDLQAVLETEVSPYRTTLVVLESVYSMGEGAAPVRDIVRTAKRFGALVLVDEAHSFGLYGPRGAGLCAEQEVSDQVDFIMTTLSKALGSVGGVVAADRDHVALLKSAARAYLFQANVSPADIAAALAALRRVRGEDALRGRLWDTATYMRERFTEAGYELGIGDGLIITPYFSDGDTLRAIARGLFSRGVLTAAVTYPIVERDRSRLRFICSSSHTREDVDRTLEALIAAEREVTAGRQTSTFHAPSDTGLRAQPEAHWTESWAEALGAYLEKALGELPLAPSLAVSIELPNDELRLTMLIDERGITHGAEFPTDTPFCTLRLVHEHAEDALRSRDVQRLLDSAVAGACVLSGQTQPFIWFVGRLLDWERSLRNPCER
ncbi:MAG: amino acid adenylation domain-containing protein [Phycicoccus sp.]